MTTSHPSPVKYRCCLPSVLDRAICLTVGKNIFRITLYVYSTADSSLNIARYLILRLNRQYAERYEHIYLRDRGDNDEPSSFIKLFVVLRPFSMSSLISFVFFTALPTIFTSSTDSLSISIWLAVFAVVIVLLSYSIFVGSDSTCLGSYETWTTALVTLQSESLTTSSSGLLSFGECSGMITVSFSIWKSHYCRNVLSFKGCCSKRAGTYVLIKFEFDICEFRIDADDFWRARSFRGFFGYTSETAGSSYEWTEQWTTRSPAVFRLIRRA